MEYSKRSDVLVIGAGHGGCQIADAIAQYNICKCIFVNSSIGDLNSLYHARPEDKIHFEGSCGCASDREMGKQLAKENMEEIFRRIDNTKASHIYIVAAAAGGTGSGSAIEMAKAIGHRYHPARTNEFRLEQGVELPDRLVHIIGIVPGQDEIIGLRGYENTFMFLKELTTLHIDGYICSYTLIDNGANSDKFMLNEQFAADFKEFLSVPENTNGLGKAIDLMDVKKAMSTRGMFQFVEFSLNEENPYAVNIYADNYFPNFTKGCNYLITTSSSDNEEYVRSIINYFGEPMDQIKCGLSSSSRAMAFAFGMEFPELLTDKLIKTYSEQLQLVEKETNKSTKLTEIL